MASPLIGGGRRRRWTGLSRDSRPLSRHDCTGHPLANEPPRPVDHLGWLGRGFHPSVMGYENPTLRASLHLASGISHPVSAGTPRNHGRFRAIGTSSISGRRLGPATQRRARPALSTSPDLHTLRYHLRTSGSPSSHDDSPVLAFGGVRQLPSPPHEPLAHHRDTLPLRRSGGPCVRVRAGRPGDPDLEPAPTPPTGRGSLGDCSDRRSRIATTDDPYRAIQP